MADHCYHVIFNPNAGTALTTGLTTAALSEIFTSAGLMFAIDDDDDDPLEERIAHAIEGPADVIVAGGGDGTVLAVAEEFRQAVAAARLPDRTQRQPGGAARHRADVIRSPCG